MLLSYSGDQGPQWTPKTEQDKTDWFMYGVVPVFCASIMSGLAGAISQWGLQVSIKPAMQQHAENEECVLCVSGCECS